MMQRENNGPAREWNGEPEAVRNVRDSGAAAALASARGPPLRRRQDKVSPRCTSASLVAATPWMFSEVAGPQCPRHIELREQNIRTLRLARPHRER